MKRTGFDLVSSKLQPSTPSTQTSCLLLKANTAEKVRRLVIFQYKMRVSTFCCRGLDPNFSLVPGLRRLYNLTISHKIYRISIQRISKCHLQKGRPCRLSDYHQLGSSEGWLSRLWEKVSWNKTGNGAKMSGMPWDCLRSQSPTKTLAL